MSLTPTPGTVVGDPTTTAAAGAGTSGTRGCVVCGLVRAEHGIRLLHRWVDPERRGRA
jgi:hypothetical protein